MCCEWGAAETVDKDLFLMRGGGAWPEMWKLGMCDGCVRRARLGSGVCHLNLRLLVPSLGFLIYSRSGRGLDVVWIVIDLSEPRGCKF